MNFNDLADNLKNYAAEDILFVGLGNTYRGDDGAGLLFLKKLQQTQQFASSRFLNVGTNPENYLQHMIDAHSELLIFIDCAEWGANPGTIDWLDADMIETVNISTHAYSIKMVEKFLQAHKPIAFKYLGIQPFQKKLGNAISLALADIIDTFFNTL